MVQILDLSSFDTSNVTNMSYMLSYCNNLESLDISSFDMSNVTSYSGFLTGSGQNTNFYIKTPVSNSLSISLPSYNSSNEFYNADDSTDTYTELPTGLESLTIIRSGGTMPVEVTSITLDHTSETIDIGDTFTITATILRTDATDTTISWTSSDEGIATVDSSGLVTGIAAGTATITATTSNNLAASCSVAVQDATVEVTSITLDLSENEIYTGDTFTIKAEILPTDATDKTISWTSSDESIATVDSNGLVTGITTGKATITATTSNNYSATCEVTVENKTIEVTGISLSETAITIYVDDTYDLVATIEPEDATDQTVLWSTAADTIASVSTSGTVTAIAVGETTITATASSGDNATCTVTVIEQEEIALHIVDNRSGAPHADYFEGSINNLLRSTYMILEDSDGSEIIPYIKADTSLSYDTMVVYDITLMTKREEGEEITDFGESTITMPLPDTYDVSNGTVTVVTMNDGEFDKSIIATTTKSDDINFVSFTTDHFTDYAFLYKAKKESNTDTDDEETEDTDDESSDNTTATSESASSDTSPAPSNIITKIVQALTPAPKERKLDYVPKTGNR